MSGSPKRVRTLGSDYADTRGINLKRRRIVLAFFAVGILLSMIREWSAPSLCIRSVVVMPKETDKR